MKKLPKRLALMLMTALVTVMAAIPTFAASTGTENTAVTGAMDTVAKDMVATGTAIIPIALTVVGISLVVVYGIKMFKKIANK